MFPCLLKQEAKFKVTRIEYQEKKDETDEKNAKRKKDKGFSVEYNKDKLLILIKEKINTGELKYISKIGEIKGMPSYRYIKKLDSHHEPST